MIDYQDKQKILLEEIKSNIKATAYLTGVSQLSPNVLNALKNVPRHIFVPFSEKEYAYSNAALPIEEEQTISQPFIVAIMTELLDIQPTDKILEIGTGSGYQAAILSNLAAEIYTVEIFASLAEKARQRFQQLKYQNIHVLIGNGANGWIENAPYNKIIVTAATEEMPNALIKQLGSGGIMVIPLGKQGQTQSLTIVKKDTKGNIYHKPILDVLFVPFVGG